MGQGCHGQSGTWGIVVMGNLGHRAWLLRATWGMVVISNLEYEACFFWAIWNMGHGCHGQLRTGGMVFMGN